MAAVARCYANTSGIRNQMRENRMNPCGTREGLGVAGVETHDGVSVHGQDRNIVA